MARPENPEIRTSIITCAQELFREKGYKATSYADIANAAGITKGLLQYYFPKKEALATTLMEGVLEKCQRALGFEDKLEPGSIETFGRMYAIGQVFFTYFLRTGGPRAFLQDIVGSMKLIDGVLAFNLTWALNYAEVSSRADEPQVIESVVRSMGGFYSLLHYSLAHGLEFDTTRHLRRVMESLMQALSFDEQQTEQLLSENELSPAQLKKIFRNW